MTKEKLNNIVEARLNEMEKALNKLPDATAIDVMILFQQWTPLHEYQAGKRLRYNDKLYQVIQTHTSQADWTPDAVPALFKEISKPSEIPVWKQPTGSHDAYMTGDKVKYPDEYGAIYVCTIDYNVYAPDVYGWELQE